jgi:hypothetical protein
MDGPAQWLRKIRSALNGESTLAPPAVIVHDPAALRAHDLDDPFFDDKVQTRMADVISSAGHKE